MRPRKLLWTALAFVALAGFGQSDANAQGNGYGYGWCGTSNGIPYSTGCSGPGMGYSARYCCCGYGCVNAYAGGYWGTAGNASWTAVYGGSGYGPAVYGNGAAPAPQTVAPAPQGITPPPPPAYPASAGKLPVIPTEKVSISRLLRSQH